MNGKPDCCSNVVGLLAAATKVKLYLLICFVASDPADILISLLQSLCVPCSGEEQPQRLSNSLSRRTAHDWEDFGLTVVAVLLSVLIAVIVLRKIVVATGNGPDVGMDADISSFE